MSGLASLAFLLVAAASGVAAGPDLDAREIAALREAAYHVSPVRAREGELDELMRQVGQSDAGLPTTSRERIRERLRRDPVLLSQVRELVAVRSTWRRRPGEVFLFWWNPRLRDRTGLPGRAPTRVEVELVEGVARRVARRHGIRLPAAIPYRIDLAASASRVFGRRDVRWGVVTPHVVDRTAAAKIVLLEVGDLPFLLDPLALLEGACAPGEPCREAVLDHARATLVSTRHVPFLEGLRAGILATEEDPAFASALLIIDHVQRRNPPAALTALLARLHPGMSEREARRAVLDITGETPRRIDREVQRALQDWAAQERETRRLSERP